MFHRVLSYAGIHSNKHFLMKISRFNSIFFSNEIFGDVQIAGIFTYVLKK